MSTKLVVGVDMAKKDFAAAIRDDNGEEELGTFENEACGHQALTEQVNGLCDSRGAQQIHLIIEATGGYEAALVAYAYEQEWLVSMPNPKQAPRGFPDWAKGVGYRVKTDRVDARILAHYGAERRPPTRPPLAAEVSNLDSLLKRRDDLEQALQKERTRLAESMGRPGISPKVQQSYQQVIEALEQALAEIEQAITRLCQTHKPFKESRKRLLALPGVGPKVVLPLMVKLFQWQTLTSGEGDAKGLTAYVGLDPQPYESGRSVRKQPGISKMGDNNIRRLLYMGALGGVRGKNPLRPFYNRLVGRGKAKKVALVAAARKILTWAWIIFSRQVEWDPAFHAN
jgi:transposase